MKKLIITLGLAVLILSGCTFLFTGCSSFQRKNYVLTETEQMYFIPPNEPFRARLTKDGPVEEVRRTLPSWAVDAGYLAKLQEEANSHITR
jgi:hypothetical protein